MKKLLSGIAALSLSLVLGVTAFAANPSQNAAPKATTTNIAAVEEISEDTSAAAEAKKVQLASNEKLADKATLSVEITPTADAAAGKEQTVGISDAAFKNGVKYVWVHVKDDKTVETGTVTAVGNTVSFEISGFSPVYFYEVETVSAAQTATGATAPKTGDNAAVPFAAAMILAAAAGVAVVSKKKAA